MHGARLKEQACACSNPLGQLGAPIRRGIHIPRMPRFFMRGYFARRRGTRLDTRLCISAECRGGADFGGLHAGRAKSGALRPSGRDTHFDSSVRAATGCAVPGPLKHVRVALPLRPSLAAEAP